MIFADTPLRGAFVVELRTLEDERGFFARSFCTTEFLAHGVDFRVAQANVCFNRKRGTLRGMHFQAAPHAEAKLVRCTQGAVWDVIIDLRPGSSTFKRWHAEELSARNRRALYIPGGFAQGFQSLTDDTELSYLMSEFYHPESAQGFRWDDPAFAIRWPVDDPIVSARDRGFPPFPA